MKLIERVQLGEITATQFEQLTGFLDAERLGLIDRVYKPETARRRRTLAKELGVSPADAEVQPLDESLDELLDVPASAWLVAGSTASGPPAPPRGGSAAGDWAPARSSQGGPEEVNPSEALPV